MDNLFEILLDGTIQTLYMTFFATVFAYIIGLPLGVLVFITSKNSIMPMKKLNAVVGWFVNVGRSIPFIILMVALTPFTRLVAGKSFGSTAAIVPLVVAAAPFVARLIETSLSEVEVGMIEAATSMGATKFQIIYKVLLPEALPSIIRGLSISTITIMGYTAMAGAAGADGLGKIAISYGFHRYQFDVLMSALVVLIVLVQIIQMIFNLLSKNIDKRNKSVS